MKIYKIYNENCLDTMARMPDGFVDLTVTSPPYDNLRTYNGSLVWNESIWKAIIKELYRVTKKGGVVVWVVGDATINGSETGTSFKQALYALECGFNLHDTMIYQKNNFSNPSNNRYHQIFEYMFILSKGSPKTFNPINDRKNKRVGVRKLSPSRKASGEMVRSDKIKTVSEFGQRYNVWVIPTQNVKGHPAPFPEELANDHIIGWSNEGDLVYDPFMGSGTTAKMAILNNRNYIGSEISKEYCEIAEKRIMSTTLRPDLLVGSFLHDTEHGVNNE